MVGLRKKRTKTEFKMGKLHWIVLGVLGIGLLAMGIKLFLVKNWSESLGMSFGVVDKEGVAVVMADPAQKRLVVVRLQKNLMVPVPAMKGTLQSGSLWRFAEDEGRPSSLTQRSLEMFLGVKLDGVLYEPDMEIGKGLKWGVFRPKKTNLSMADRWKLMWYLGQLRDDQIKKMEMPVSKAKTVETPDGRQILELDSQRLDSVRSNFKSLLVTNSQGRVLVRGGIERSLLLLGERMLTAVGGLVVEVKSGDEDKVKRCEVRVGGSLSGEEVVKWMGQKFNCSIKKLDIESGQIELLLGEDWEKFYTTN